MDLSGQRILLRRDLIRGSVAGRRGTYSLRIDADLAREDRHEDTWRNATSIGFARAVSGAVSPATDRDYYSFTAKKGAKYTFTPLDDSAEALSLAVEESDNNRTRVLASNYGEGTEVSWIALTKAHTISSCRHLHARRTPEGLTPSA